MKRENFGIGCIVLFCLPFCGVGVWAAVMSVLRLLDGNWKEAGFLLIFSLAFGGAGFGMLGWMIYGIKKGKLTDAEKAKYPDQPWMWKPDWAIGKVKSTTVGTMIFVWVFAIFWNLISAPIPFVLFNELSKDEWDKPVLIAAIFPVVAICLLVWAVRATSQWKKYGVSMFEMSSVPGLIGGKLAGIIHTNINIRPEGGFKLKLACINRAATESGDSRNTTEHVLWEDEKTMGNELLARDMSRSAIPVMFHIPFECRPVDETNADSTIIWRLEARAKVPGSDYHGQFEVPVFKTEESDPDYVGSDDAIADYLVPETEEDIAASSKILIRHTASGGTEFFFPPARNPGAAMNLTAFTAVWWGIEIALLKFGAPLIFPILFGLFAVLLLYGTLWIWTGTTHIEVVRGRVSIRSGFLGIGRTREYECKDVRTVATSRGMRSGSTQHYDIHVLTTNDKKIKVGGSIKRKREAEWLAHEIESRIRASQ